MADQWSLSLCVTTSISGHSCRLPISVSTAFTYIHIEFVYVFVCFNYLVCFYAFVYAPACVRFSVRASVCSNARLCDDGTSSSRVIMHLLRKCCQIMLTPQPGAVCGERRGDEWEGMECVYIMHMSHFPTFQQLHTPKVETRGMQPMPT